MAINEPINPGAASDPTSIRRFLQLIAEKWNALLAALHVDGTTLQAQGAVTVASGATITGDIAVVSGNVKLATAAVSAGVSTGTCTVKAQGSDALENAGFITVEKSDGTEIFIPYFATKA